MALIELMNLRKVYPSAEAVVALDGVNLVVNSGDFLALMGPSGSGKSTLLNVIGCLDRPTSGSYFFEGSDVSRLSPNELARIRNAKIGFIFQSFNLLPRATAEANVELPMIYYGLSRGKRMRRAAELLEAVGLSGRASHRPNQLSGGQQQRVAIARALANNPPLLLADEPTGNLDSRAGSEIMDLLQGLNGKGQTVILITHDPVVAERARRVIQIRDGRFVDEVMR
jgi:putative ABC transport system ATP-binding protein